MQWKWCKENIYCKSNWIQLKTIKVSHITFFNLVSVADECDPDIIDMAEDINSGQAKWMPVPSMLNLKSNQFEIYQNFVKND